MPRKKTIYDEVKATNEDLRNDIVQMLQEDNRKSVHVFIRGFVHTLTQSADAEDKITHVLTHLDEYTEQGEPAEDRAALEAALMEALAAVWNMIYTFEDINVVLDACAKVAQTGLCAVDPGGTHTITQEDLHGVFFMLSNTLFEKHAEITAVVDAAHRIVSTNDTLQEVNKKRLTLNAINGGKNGTV